MNITDYWSLIKVSQDLQASLEIGRKSLVKSLTDIYAPYLPDIVSGVCDPYPTYFLYFKGVLFVWYPQDKVLRPFDPKDISEESAFAAFAKTREHFWDELMLLDHTHNEYLGQKGYHPTEGWRKP